MNKIKVDNVRITIGRKTLELTPDELRELRDVLDATFPKEKTVYVPSAPIIIERPRWPRPYRYWKPIWCDSTTAGCTTLSLTSNASSAL